ncbi:MAG: ABC transporter ATP-binding protein [Desulfobacteraceae bacterium]|nr:ABC transporter ATP-binding protein [Desulfobacteraceae bacterium]
MTLLTVENMSISLTGSGRPLTEGISFSLGKGDRLGLIGESGSGKSITALALLGLLPGSMRVTGRIVLAGTEVTNSSESELVRIRGSKATMVFQEPLSALDPLMRVGRQIAGPLKLHRGLVGDASQREIRALLHRVQLPEPGRIAASFPHELSGGQRQRIAIAMALACKPEILIADEPTTALDVTVQGEILSLLDELVTEEGMSLIFITHDLPVISRVVRRLLVMQDGRIVEDGSTAGIIASPQHAETKKLIEAARLVTVVPYVSERRGAK